jgi:hypothetical protein
LSGYNNSISAVAETAIKKRRERLLANQGRMAALEIPLKVRANAPKTYAAPTIRKKIARTLPKASAAPFELRLIPDLDDKTLILLQVNAAIMDFVPMPERQPLRLSVTDAESHMTL